MVNLFYLHYDFSASVTATFVLEDMTEKHFMRSVNGQSSEHKIDGQVSIAFIAPVDQPKLSPVRKVIALADLK